GRESAPSDSAARAVSRAENEPRATDQDDAGDSRKGWNRAPPRAPVHWPPRGGHARHLPRAGRGQRLHEFSGRLIAIGGHFFERALDDDFEIVGNGVPDNLEPRDRVEIVR